MWRTKNSPPLSVNQTFTQHFAKSQKNKEQLRHSRPVDSKPQLQKSQQAGSKLPRQQGSQTGGLGFTSGVEPPSPGLPLDVNNNTILAWMQSFKIILIALFFSIQLVI